MSVNGWIKRNLYWANDYLHGRPVGKYYDDLEAVHTAFESGRKIQKQHLDELLSYAAENSPYYAQFALGGGRSLELAAFPVVNKSILIENHAAVCVPVEKIPGQGDRPLYIQKTSGSTGTPFAVPQDVGKRNRRVAEIKYFNELVGFKSHEMLGQCRIWTQWHNKSSWQVFKENIIPISIAKMDDETTAELIQTVKKHKLVALRAYASWYETLVDYLASGKGDPADLKSLKVCFSTSEALNEVTRIKMRELTGVSIIETYADEEAGMMGQKLIDDDNFYMNHSGYVFEFLKMDSDEPAEPGEVSRIVLTDLYNHAFPLIRYDTGDTAVYQVGNERSNGWPYVSRLYGRRMDLVYNTQGQPIHPMNFARILKNLPGIVQYQFVQRGANDYLIRLNITQKCDVDGLLGQIKGVLGEDANINIEYVDDIPVLASGKRKPVVCEWVHE